MGREGDILVRIHRKWRWAIARSPDRHSGGKEMCGPMVEQDSVSRSSKGATEIEEEEEGIKETGNKGLLISALSS